MTKTVYLFVPNETIKLNKEGQWLSNGEEITHILTKRAFSKNLVEEEGKYLIRLGDNEKEIEVEDTPFFIKSVQEIEEEGIKVSLNDDTEEVVSWDSLRYEPSRLICRVKNNLFDAKFLRPAYHKLLQHVEEDDESFYLSINDKRILLWKKKN